MATPFKRVCLHAVRQHPCRPALQWRSFSNTASQLSPNNAADEAALHNLELPPAPSDADLDRLASQPGVIYTSTETPEVDLSSVNLTTMSSLAHRELAQHREQREITRLAAWKMPELTALAKEFTPPDETQVLRWRYTTYMGESHPAQHKVVVDFSPSQLQPKLTEAQRGKLLKLVGARYDPRTRRVKMSCEAFESQARNKRFLAETIGKLLAEVRDPQADSFEDVPVDKRHAKKRPRYRFPMEWAVTEERRKVLEEGRKQALLEEGQRVEEGRIVSGLTAIEAARVAGLEKARELEHQAVMARPLLRTPPRRK